MRSIKPQPSKYFSAYLLWKDVWSQSVEDFVAVDRTEAALRHRLLSFESLFQLLQPANMFEAGINNYKSRRYIQEKNINKDKLIKLNSGVVWA